MGRAKRFKALAHYDDARNFTQNREIDMTEKETRDYWSECGQVFFIGGIGYGLTEELETIPLGNEADILETFETGKLPDYLMPRQRQVLEKILEYRSGVYATKFEVRRPGDFRSIPAGTAKRRAANLRQAKARKRAPVYQTK